MPSSGNASKSVSAGAPAATGRIGCAWLSIARIDVMYLANAESIGAWAANSPLATKPSSAMHQNAVLRGLVMSLKKEFGRPIFATSDPMVARGTTQRSGTASRRIHDPTV